MVKPLTFVIMLTLLALEVASVTMWLVLGQPAPWGVYPGAALALMLIVTAARAASRKVVG